MRQIFQRRRRQLRLERHRQRLAVRVIVGGFIALLIVGIEQRALARKKFVAIKRAAIERGIEINALQAIMILLAALDGAVDEWRLNAIGDDDGVAVVVGASDANAKAGVGGRRPIEIANALVGGGGENIGLERRVVNDLARSRSADGARADGENAVAVKDARLEIFVLELELGGLVDEHLAVLVVDGGAADFPKELIFDAEIVVGLPINLTVESDRGRGKFSVDGNFVGDRAARLFCRSDGDEVGGDRKRLFRADESEALDCGSKIFERGHR